MPSVVMVTEISRRGLIASKTSEGLALSAGVSVEVCRRFRSFCGLCLGKDKVAFVQRGCVTHSAMRQWPAGPLEDLRFVS